MAFATEIATGQRVGDQREQQSRRAIFSSQRQDGVLRVVVAEGMSALSGVRMAAGQAGDAVRSAREPRHDEPPCSPGLPGLSAGRDR